jgi:hypothetical protein
MYDNEGAPPNEIRAPVEGTRSPALLEPKVYMPSSGEAGAGCGGKLQYCASNPSLDTEIHFWHGQLQYGNPVAQLEIDRRIFACLIEDSRVFQRCVGLGNMPHHSLFFLDYDDTVQVDNLPDLIWVFRDRLLHGQYHTQLQETLFRYSIPCIRKSKHIASKHTGKDRAPPQQGSSNHTENQGVSTTDPYGSYIVVMFGALLGLYPHCSKFPTFPSRKQVLAHLHALLTSPLSAQKDFLVKHVNLVRLCMMEYFVYVLHTFCCTEKSLISRCLDLQVYTTLCQTSVDQFRQTCLQSEVVDWDDMDGYAFKTTDKIIRTTRIGVKLATNTGNVIGIRRLSNVWVSKPDTVELVQKLILGIPPCFWHKDSIFMYSCLITDWLTEHGWSGCVKTLAEKVSVVHNMMHVYEMPLNFTIKQTAAILQKFGNDHMLIHNICKKTLCLRCIMNIKQASNAYNVVDNTRMCMQTCQLKCNRCNSSDSMISINMLGKWLQIERYVYFICPFCVRMHVWSSTAKEFLSCDYTETCLKQKRKRGGGGKSTVCSSREAPVTRQRCYVCQKQCTNTFNTIVDVRNFAMVHVSLCSKHYIPLHMQKFITNVDHLNRYFNESGVSCFHSIDNK